MCVKEQMKQSPEIQSFSWLLPVQIRVDFSTVSWLTIVTKVLIERTSSWKFKENGHLYWTRGTIENY